MLIRTFNMAGYTKCLTDFKQRESRAPHFTNQIAHHVVFIHRSSQTPTLCMQTKTQIDCSNHTLFKAGDEATNDSAPLMQSANVWCR